VERSSTSPASICHTPVRLLMPATPWGRSPGRIRTPGGRTPRAPQATA
jgi:hypothetical protein